MMLKKIFIILIIFFTNINSCLKRDRIDENFVSYIRDLEIKICYCKICGTAAIGSYKEHLAEKHTCSICQKVVEQDLTVHKYLKH